MKCLKIKNDKGYFLDANEEYKEIDLIKKEDVLHLVQLATKKDYDFEIDNAEECSLKNEAHRIIYLSLSKKFEELLNNKNRFIDESEGKYKDALLKYSNE